LAPYILGRIVFEPPVEYPYKSVMNHDDKQEPKDTCIAPMTVVWFDWVFFVFIDFTSDEEEEDYDKPTTEVLLLA